MIIHPNLEWLQNIEDNIHDVDWRQAHLDEIMDSLRDYLFDVQYILSASAILDICFEDMLGQGRYSELLDLHTVAINIFDSDNSISSDFDRIEDLSLGNTQRFVNEYFRLKLNLSHVALLLHNGDLARQQLEHIRRLYVKATPIDQLDAYCLFLKYHAYGYEMDLDFDLVGTTQKLANKFFNEFRLKGEIAIAYYHYSKGNIPAMEHVLRKTHRLMSKTRRDTFELTKIGAVMAELNFYLAVMYRELHQYDKAFTKLDIASDQYARLNNHVQNMLVHYETAMIYHHKQQTDKALAWINLAYNEFEYLKEKQDYHRAMLDHGKGLILLNLERYNEALTLFQRVLLIWEKHRHSYHSACAINDIGAATNGLERPSEALEYFAKAKIICDPIKDRDYVKELIRVIDENIEDAISKL